LIFWDEETKVEKYRKYKKKKKREYLAEIHAGLF
jgi:hypothetical protein